MPTLFDIVNRRRRAKEFTEGFREGATPEELEYYDRFYQEPSASPVMERGALGAQIDEVEALKRQLMARGMNNLQAEDRARRELAQEEAATTKRGEDYATIYGPGGVSEASEGGFRAYQEGLRPDPPAEVQPTIGDFPEPPSEDWITRPLQQQGLSLEDWSRQKALQQGMAGDVSGAVKAEYDVETLPGRIEEARISLEALPALIDAKVIDATLGRRINEAILKEVDILESTNDPIKRTESIQRIDGYNRILGRLRSSGTAMPGQDPNQWTDADKKELETLTLESEGATAGTVGGTRMITPMPTTERVSGDYSRGVSTRTPGQQSEEGRAAAIRRRNRDYK